ncbi:MULTISPECIES: hypothetical protein [Acinetobacter]|uniref:Uncharacterized protein n=4 Tax=Acinetobacter baumannii TaxID=470 RepID=A0AAJ0VNI2_ACIBA|nr:MULTISPECIES: hypothetical protein [Acinetobacter]SSW75206.1 Uncharacterised protein [Klebsiella pneumoniae]EHF3479160.1 hypothetical protein [Acinetobacter baumannii]EHU1298174.1 hypothetical protein [Acinetobacter baumannii]EHU2820127.1 hypothetical protein [Acinetobacter baumannii]EHU2824658.1 hypothetical protein [Acinetobacter baumannii]
MIDLKNESYISNIPQYLVDAYLETENFPAFLQQNRKHCYWMIFSDYSFKPRFPKKPVITATIIPFSDYRWIQTICNLSKLKTNLDIKKTYINEKYISFIKFIEWLPAFHISLIVDENLNYYKNENINEKEYFKRYFEGVKVHYGNHINYAVVQPNPKMNIGNINRVLKLLNGQPKIRIFKQSQIVSSLISSVSKLIVDSTQVECKILWCSDTDDILSYSENSLFYPFVFDMIRTDLYRLRPQKIYQIDFLKKVNKDFDELIRIPDYIVGTISDLNLKELTVTHGKFLPVLYSFLTNSNKNLIISLTNTSNKIELTKYEFKKLVEKEPDWSAYG